MLERRGNLGTNLEKNEGAISKTGLMVLPLAQLALNITSKMRTPTKFFNCSSIVRRRMMTLPIQQFSYVCRFIVSKQSIKQTNEPLLVFISAVLILTEYTTTPVREAQRETQLKNCAILFVSGR